MALTNDQTKAFLAQALPIIQAAGVGGLSSDQTYDAHLLVVDIIVAMDLQNDPDPVAAAVKVLSA